MRFRFTGQYTNGHTSINACGVVFEGREPADVTDPAAIARLSGHPEFEHVASAEPLTVAEYHHQAEAVITFEQDPAEHAPFASTPRRRGRKPKAAQ